MRLKLRNLSLQEQTQTLLNKTTFSCNVNDLTSPIPKETFTYKAFIKFRTKKWTISVCPKMMLLLIVIQITNCKKTVLLKTNSSAVGINVPDNSFTFYLEHLVTSFPFDQTVWHKLYTLQKENGEIRGSITLYLEYKNLIHVVFSSLSIRIYM